MGTQCGDTQQVATLKMSEPWRDPRTGIWKLRKRIPQRFRQLARQKGEFIKISTETADRKEALKRWPDVLHRWEEMQAEWERLLNVVLLTPEGARVVAAKWAAWIAEDISRLQTDGQSSLVFDDGF